MRREEQSYVEPPRWGQEDFNLNLTFCRKCNLKKIVFCNKWKIAMQAIESGSKVILPSAGLSKE